MPAGLREELELGLCVVTQLKPVWIMNSAEGGPETRVKDERRRQVRSTANSERYDLISVACVKIRFSVHYVISMTLFSIVIGDCESESGPTPTAWHA